MGEMNLLVEEFERQRSALLRLAYRIVGVRAEAEEIIQEAWIRLAGSRSGEIKNLQGWLKTVVGRLSIDVLRKREVRRETAIDDDVETLPAGADLEHALELAGDVGHAMMSVLKTLSPAERTAFVLHDMFDVPFENIGTVLERSAVVARQAASRARRRIQGGPSDYESDKLRQHEIVSAFLTAAQMGDFVALLGILDPDVVLRVDAAAVAASVANATKGAARLEGEMVGRDLVASTFQSRARDAQLVSVDEFAALFMVSSDHVYAVLEFAVEHGKIVEMVLIADPVTIEGISLASAVSVVNQDRAVRFRDSGSRSRKSPLCQQLSALINVEQLPARTRFYREARTCRRCPHWRDYSQRPPRCDLHGAAAQ